MKALNTATVVGLARDLERKLEGHPVALAEALVELVKNLLRSADETRKTISADVFVQRGLDQWDRDRARIQQQLDRVFMPSIRGDEGRVPADTVQEDVIEPIIRGRWPTWMTDLPQYRDGVPAGDPLLPNARTVGTGATRYFETIPVAAAAASLWSQVHVAAQFDDSQGATRLRAVLTATAAAFETPDDAGNPGEFNVWETVRGWANSAGELAGKAGSSFWETGYLQTFLWGGAALIAGGLALKYLFNRKR